jgi:hypothetical protein
LLISREVASGNKLFQGYQGWQANGQGLSWCFVDYGRHFGFNYWPEDVEYQAEVQKRCKKGRLDPTCGAAFGVGGLSLSTKDAKSSRGKVGQKTSLHYVHHEKGG